MLDRIFDYGIQGAFGFLISLAYEDAVRRGIRNAGDEQHRMTPLSPWRLFLLGFGQRARWIGIAAVPWLFCGVYLANYAWHFYAIDFSTWLFVFDLGSVYFMLKREVPWLGGLVLGSWALITLMAPRLGNIGIAALLGTAMVTFMRIYAEWLRWGLYSDYHSWLVLGFGLVAFALAWIYARFILNRAWFRFEG